MLRAQWSITTLVAGVFLCFSPWLRAAPTTREAASLDTPIPELNLQDVSLNDVVGYLQDLVPNFKAVIVRDPGVPDGYPLIQVKLRNVTGQQLLELLQTAYGVQIDQIPSGGISCIRVHADPSHPLGAASHNATRLRVYSLGDVVKAVVKAQVEPPKDPSAATKLALDEALTVIKTALTHVEERPSNPVLEVHEPTQMLVFRGTAAEQEALEDALGALLGQQTAAQHQIDDLKAHLDAMQRELELTKTRADEQVASARDQLQEARARLEEQEKEYFQVTVENERLKVRLEAREPAPASREKAADPEKK